MCMLIQTKSWCAYMHTDKHTHTHTHTHTYQICMCMHACMHACMYVYMYVCMYTFIHTKRTKTNPWVCMYVCMYVWSVCILTILAAGLPSLVCVHAHRQTHTQTRTNAPDMYVYVCMYVWSVLYSRLWLGDFLLWSVVFLDFTTHFHTRGLAQSFAANSFNGGNVGQSTL
jgi:hypothetical protein